MKTIIFRPLRLVKKSNKITVASYLSWRKVQTTDYERANILINTEYRKFKNDEFVYNHEGELLYFYTYNPNDIPIISSCVDRELNPDYNYITEWKDGARGYLMHGCDCDGIPCFSHYTQDRVAESSYHFDEFEPLTVGTVKMWYLWFIMKLNNTVKENQSSQIK